MNDIMAFASSPLGLMAAFMGALLIICRTILAGWRDWISLKRAEISAPREAGQRANDGSESYAASRIEVADIRERLRKLEAIAAGVDL